MDARIVQDSADSLPGTIHNFTIYKFRYRWQKRILQIDFISKIIFNIEKGTLKKQFPFSQVKTVVDNGGIRLCISFHGHQDYELEASSQEDKKCIMNLLNIIIQGNEKSSPAKSTLRRNSQTDVLREGMLELLKHGPNSEKWVKYLVKLREDELILYFIGIQEKTEGSEPAETIIQLINATVSASTHNGLPTFSVQTKENHYMFRLSIPEHTKVTVDMKKLRDEWVDLLSNYCTQLQSQPPTEAIYYSIAKVNNSKTSCQVPTDQVTPEQKKRENSPVPAASLNTPISLVPLLPPPYEPLHHPPPLPPKRAISSGVSPLPSPLPASPSARKTKAFHWDQVPQKQINTSIWAVCTLGQKNIDMLRIFDQFSVACRSAFPDNLSDCFSSQKILLDHKIAHNFSIVLKSFHIEPSQLKDKLLIIHERDGGLSNEQIKTLRRYVPTPKDIKMYQSLNGSLSELHIVDQFMFEMCNIPNLSRRLDVLLTIRELPVCMNDLYPLISRIMKACQQLLASQSFVAVLEYLLAIGNYLNENAGKEKANGFRLSTLAKLSQLWGKERKFTLLHALVEQIFLHEPDLTTFSMELTEFESVPGASIKGLIAEVDVTRKQLEKIVEYSKHIKSKKTPQEAPFYNQLKDIIQKYEEEHTHLSKKCEEMKKLYNDVLLKFGETQDQDSQELFGWISSFLEGFNKVRSEF